MSQTIVVKNTCFDLAEDPSENFQRVRDYVDVKNCSSLKEYNSSNIHSNFTSAMAQAARERFKINKVNFIFARCEKILIKLSILKR